MRFFLACALTILLFANTTTVFAQTNQQPVKFTAGQINDALNHLTPVRFLPNNPLYFLIRAKELVSRFFKPSSRERAQFDYVISSKRLREAYLLLEKGQSKESADALNSYSKTIKNLQIQLEKARTQNQDIVPVVDDLVVNLEYQETILEVIVNANIDNDYFANKLKLSEVSFDEFVNYLDKIKPGVKGRFRLFGDNNLPNSSSSSSSPTVGHFPSGESTPVASPKRIIY